MRKLRLFLMGMRDLSVIILVWAALLYGWMSYDATVQCMRYNAYRAVATLRWGAVCVQTVYGTEQAAPLSVLKGE